MKEGDKMDHAMAEHIMRAIQHEGHDLHDVGHEEMPDTVESANDLHEATDHLNMHDLEFQNMSEPSNEEMHEIITQGTTNIVESNVEHEEGGTDEEREDEDMDEEEDLDDLEDNEQHGQIHM